MHPVRDIGAKCAADVDQRVVDGIADGAHIFVRRARRCSDDAWLDHRHAQRRQHQHKRDQRHQRQGVAQRSQPRRSERAEEEIRARQNQVSNRQGAAEAEAIGNRSSKYRQDPDQPAKKPRKIRRPLGGKVQRFVEIPGKGSESSVVREPLKQFAEVGDPERALKPGSHFCQTLVEAHATSRGCKRG